MAYLKITPGVGALSDAGRILSFDPHRVDDETKTAVLQRDDFTCRYCGFKSRKYQEANYVGSGDPKTLNTDAYVTACTFCYQCFHLDKVERMQSGTLIYLPEIGQATLHHICRAIYVARISQGPMADAARDAMEALLARKAEAKNRLGTDSPRILATVFQDFFEGAEYKNRMARFKGFRILPLDRRVIKEGDLEFNQFPQVLAFWRSKDGPFGEMTPKKWAKYFYDTRALLPAGESSQNKQDA